MRDRDRDGGFVVRGEGIRKGACKQADLNKGMYHPVYKLRTKCPLVSTLESRVQKGLEKEQLAAFQIRASNQGSIIGVYMGLLLLMETSYHLHCDSACAVIS